MDVDVYSMPYLWMHLWVHWTEEKCFFFKYIFNFFGNMRDKKSHFSTSLWTLKDKDGLMIEKNYYSCHRLCKCHYFSLSFLHCCYYFHLSLSVSCSVFSTCFEIYSLFLKILSSKG